MDKQRARSVGRRLAMSGSVLAIVLGYFVITWIFWVRPTFYDYLAFIAASALLAIIGALPGMVVGALLAKGNQQQEKSKDLTDEVIE